jgi:glycosyltransferase involved in cell wall biosynthesis
MRCEKKLYVLHEQGANRHYEGLQYYCNENNIKIIYREFTPVRQLFSGIKNFKGDKIKKAFVNFKFLIQLVCFKKKNVVLGVAPFDFRMVFFNYIARKNNVYYHTSWPYWDENRAPKKTFLCGPKRTKALIFDSWSSFLEQRCKGVFCVTTASQKGLESKYHITCPIQVVNHSVNPDVFFPKAKFKRQGPIKFLFVGRLEKIKGLDIILELSERFSEKDFILGIVGSGTLRKDVLRLSKNRPNMKYFGQIQNDELGDVFRNYDFLLLPSITTVGNVWEELFGISIIEGMACGLIPITTSHVGPLEIIEDNLNGFLCRQDNVKKDLETALVNIFDSSEQRIAAIQNSAVLSSSKYHNNRIAEKWGVILCQT